ncbi:DUF6349 family protein [Streptomyces sp. CB01201]|uniref:DUF6349 family protein n=1 Tax=Streptomyces sp. CB01201 TaxID=2020324 RepID=UPI003FA37AD6
MGAGPLDASPGCWPPTPPPGVSTGGSWPSYAGVERAGSRETAKHVRATNPKGWFDAGGPLRLYIEPPFDRHEAGAAPGGGFILYEPVP